MAFLAVLDGSNSFDALRLEILQAQITFHWSATWTTYLIYMYDVTPENKNMYVWCLLTTGAQLDKEKEKLR